MSNELTKLSFSQAIQTKGVQSMITSVLGDPKRAARFTASITSAVTTTPALKECDTNSILSAALLGESLELSPSPQLGQFYMVPFGDKNGPKKAQFILGYKGYIQLAIRSGQYKKLNVLAIKKGELIRFDPLNEEIEVSLIDDEIKRELADTIGYYAMFEYVNGFKKAMYWSKQKMEQHALRYSQGYKAKKGYTFWEKDFDGMAFKTMLRQLLSKWGILSVEMRQAFESDDAIIATDGSAIRPADVENAKDVTPPEVKSEPEPEGEAENVSLDAL